MNPSKLVLVCLLVGARLAFATVGIAEWEIPTPGGNRIAHTDTYKEEHGTCLHSGADNDSRVFVSYLQNWTYYKGYVTGEAKQGFFLFDERSKIVLFFKTEAELDSKIKETNLGKPTSKRLDAGDGWSQTWIPIFKANCEKMKNTKSGDADTDRLMREKCKEFEKMSP